MTAAVARSSVRTAVGVRPQRATGPKLKVLNQEAIRQRARRRNALLFTFIVVLVGFFGVAFVHAQLVAGQQDLDSIRTRIAEAEAHRAKVARLVEEASAPDVIVSRAEGLGMVRAHQPVYLQAVAPVRELPVAATFVRQGAPEHLDVAAGVSASASNISTGISASAEVGADVDVPSETPQSQVVAIGQPESPVAISSGTPTIGEAVAGTEVAAAPVSTISTPTPAPIQANTPAPAGTVASTGTVSSTGGAFGGVSVATSGQPSGAVTSSELVGISTGSGQASAGQPQSSFAGSRAVSGGQGSG